MTNTGVTKDQAEAVLHAVEAKFRPFLLDFPVNEFGQINYDGELVEQTDPAYRPKLIENWDGKGHYAVVWEDNSPYEWAIGGIDWDSKDEEYGWNYEGQDLPAGVFCEPYYSFVLVIYPA